MTQTQSIHNWPQLSTRGGKRTFNHFNVNELTADKVVEIGDGVGITDPINPSN